MTVPTDQQDALLQKLRNLIERSGEKEDTFGSEMADDARVWRVYSKAAQKHDKELLAQWNGTLDTLLIFAGLFSAVSTTFIIDAYKQMQPDYAQETFRLLLENMSGTRYMEPSGHVEESARAVNCLWISSLIASLSTALIAILAKQWLASYPVSDRENLREWAQLRQYRFDALERWQVPVLVAVVPALLHLSLMLFLAGLVVFLWDIDTGTMILALILSAATYGLYGFTTLSPVLWSSSPFRTPLTPVLQRIARRCVNSLIGDVLGAIASPCADALHSRAVGVMKICLRKAWIKVFSSVLPFRKALYWVPFPITPGQRTCPPAVDPWVTQTVFTPGVVAGALSWLAMSAETVDLYHAVLDSLGDDGRGATVAGHLAPALQMRIRMQTPYRLSDCDPSDLRVAVTHLRAAYYLRTFISSPDVAPWISRQFTDVRSGSTDIRTPRLYDTILRVLEKVQRKNKGLVDLNRFFGDPAGQEGCESPSLVLSSTARGIAQLFIRVREPAGSTRFRSNVLAMLNALRSHLVASPDVAADLLKSSFARVKGSIDDEGPLRARPPHSCRDASCEAMNYLVVILARHNFAFSPDLSTEVARSLKSRTFETFALFCRQFLPSRYCDHLSYNLASWSSKQDPLSQISPKGRDILAVVRCFRPSMPLRFICHLLHLDHSWSAPDSSDPFRDEALDICLDSITDNNWDDRLSTLRSLLDDACLEPLQRAPHWNVHPLLSWCAIALAKASSDGSDVDGVLSRFVFCEVKGGPNGAITRTWDLVVAASQYILAAAERADSLDGWSEEPLAVLCHCLGTLRRRHPHKARWKEMGDRVKHGTEFLTDSAWKARTDPAAAVNFGDTREVL